MTAPTVAGFTAFIRNVMGINTTVLPDSSDVIPEAFAVALEIVNRTINNASPIIYNLAVYNLAGDNLLNYAQDLPGAPIIPGSDPAAPYFQNARNKWNINGFVSGTISAASDESTSESLVVPKQAENFTLGDLQNLKTPYGRQYLAFAQRWGSDLWGLS